MRQSKVTVFEVGPRDGLQNEKERLSVEVRVEFIKKLSACGLKKIEIGAFVSDKWVPQMAASEQVIEEVYALKDKALIPNDILFSALVPNFIGFENALKTSIDEVAIFGAASESFSKANINCSIEESIKRFKDILENANTSKMPVRGYLSTVFSCPYEGLVSEEKVLALIEKYFELGIYEISLGDTIGTATPKQVRSLLEKVLKIYPAEKIAMHFHDTRGIGIANVLASLDLGIRTFDSSLGGLGGCPYAPNSTGNIATEDLVFLLDGMGFSTGIDLSKLIEVNKWMGDNLKRALTSRTGRAGVFVPQGKLV